MDALLVLNAGSSSVKFAAFEQAGKPETLQLIGKGHVAQLGVNVELLIKSAEGEELERSNLAASGNSFDHDAAMDRLFTWIDAHRGGLNLVAVGHRVVHGGAKYLTPVRVNAEVMAELEKLIPLAPLHQPHNLKAIRIAAERWPSVPQVVCFDTAFHSTQPKVAQAFALPREITDLDVRRYGFHGLSYEYIASQLPRVLGDRANGKVIVAHLGNGASLCAMHGGQSVASTMGFSALDGLVMGTRCGTLDAGVVLYLLQERHLSAEAISDMLYSHSGLLGVSGFSSDMAVLLTSKDVRAAEAIDLFVYRIVGAIGALAAAMGGVDALVFTAGIGEHAAPVRQRICSGCEWLGALLDETANDVDLELIHAPTSALQLAVIPTDEEYMIALHTLACTGSVVNSS